MRAFILTVGLAACAGHVCMLCVIPMMGKAPSEGAEMEDGGALSPQRIQQGIARDMGRCIHVHGQEHNAEALRCVCEAGKRCLAAGLPKGCAWDEWALETAGHYPVIVGRCEDLSP